MFTQSHLYVPLLNRTLLGKCSGKTLQSPKEEFMQNCVKTLFMTSSFREVGCCKKEENTGFSALTLNLSQFRCCDNLKRAVPSKQPIHIETLNRLVRWIDQKPYKQQQQHKFGEDFIAKAGSTCSWFTYFLHSVPWMITRCIQCDNVFLWYSFNQIVSVS